MSENNYSNVIESLLKNVDHLVGAKTVVGDAVTIGDTTIVPLVDVA